MDKNTFIEASLKIQNLHTWIVKNFESSRELSLVLTKLQEKLKK